MSTPFRFKNADNTTVDFEDYYVRADYFRSGNLWAWGRNTTYGSLGDNTIINRSSPVQTVTGGTNWKQVSGGGYINSAGVKTDGTLWCWADNAYGQLGDNTTVKKSSPVQTIAGGTNWNQVSSGYSTAAIKTDGTLWMWGRNNEGQLGDNTATNKSSPIQTIAYGTNWKQVSFKYRTIAAIMSDGTLWMWGRNTEGQIGDNTTTHRSSPVQTIAGGTNWKQVSSGLGLTAAIKTDGTLWCFGGSTYGELGDNTIIGKSSPVQTVCGGTNWKQVSSGYRQIVAIKTDGTLWTWGRGDNGQLGNNTIEHKSSPIQTIAYGTNWKQGDCGVYHAAGIKTDGTLWTWGWNAYGQLGYNTATQRSSPVQTVAGGTNWMKVSCGTLMMAAIKYQDDYQ